MALTAKQEQFCQEYIIDLNATQAAIRAGYSENSADVEGARQLVNAKVAARIAELKENRSKRTQITQDRVLKELASIGFAKIDDFVNVIEVEKEKQVIGDDERETFEPEIIKYKAVDIKVTKDIPTDKIPAISSIKQGRDGIELKLHDKVKALELMGRHLGIFEKDNAQRKPDTSTIANLSPEQLNTLLLLQNAASNKPA